MKPRLPGIPFEITGRLREYISSLVERLAEELDNRVERQQGSMYVTSDKPLRIVSADGVATFEIGVTMTGELVLTPVNTNTISGSGPVTADDATLVASGSVTP